MLEFVIVAEAEADSRIASDLADRVLMEEGPEMFPSLQWIGDQDPQYFRREILPGLRKWAGIKPETEFTTWAGIKTLGKRFPALQYLRPASGKPQNPDYAQGRKAILLSILLRKENPPDALILVRDLDSQKERRDGLAQAKEEDVGRLAVVIATPNPKREAWVLNGFNPANDDERRELDSVNQQIGFDACREAERLRYTSQTSRPERDPKRILTRLTNQDSERERQCWAGTPLATLRERGEATYLKDYLDEIKTRLLPLLVK
jgi:hypothetical protein